MKRTKADNNAVSLNTLTGSQLPDELKIAAYVDVPSLSSECRQLFESGGDRSVLEPLIALDRNIAALLEKKRAGLGRMKEVTPPAAAIVTGKVRVFAEGAVEFQPMVLKGPEEGEGMIFLGKDTEVTGASLIVDNGPIAVGEGTILGPGSTVTGPSWIGTGNEIRPGAYLRAHVFSGENCLFRCEAKRTLFCDGAQIPHLSYIGDSIIGRGGHFGNQTTTANISLANASREEGAWKPVELHLPGLTISTGLPKLGVVMGDSCQAGCGAVFDPGVFLRRSTWVYPLSRVKSGFYGPDCIIRNRPERAGVMDIISLEQPRG